MPFYFENVKTMIDGIQAAETKDEAYKAINTFLSELVDFRKAKKISERSYYDMRNLAWDLEYQVSIQ